MSFQLNKTLTDLLKYYIILKAIHIFYKMTTKYGPISNLISRKTSLLDTFSTSSPNKSNRSTWAAVTGASSGIGRAYALALASQGFNLILIARRRERLLALATHLKDTYNVETHIVVSDLSKLNSTNTKDLVDQITKSDIYSNRNIVSNLDVGILICNAGISDVNYSFTNEPIHRTEAMVMTNCTSLALLVHEFLPRLEQRMTRSSSNFTCTSSAIITSGALNSDLPLVSNSLSSGTKAFVRNFTLSVNETTPVEMLCGHPLAVESEILEVKSDGFWILNAKDYVTGVLNTLRKGGTRETYSVWQHELIHESLLLWPTIVILKGSRACTKWFADMVSKE